MQRTNIGAGEERGGVMAAGENFTTAMHLQGKGTKQVRGLAVWRLQAWDCGNKQPSTCSIKMLLSGMRIMLFLLLCPVHDTLCAPLCRLLISAGNPGG
jgi:hypothetical protein